MRIYTILFFSGIIYLSTFSHLNSSGLFANGCTCESTKLLASYYIEHKDNIVTLNTVDSIQYKIHKDSLSDYYTQYIHH